MRSVARFDDDDPKRKHVSGGRVSRFIKLSSLTTSVGASMVGDKLIGRVLPKDQREKRTRRALEKNAARVVKTMGEMKGAAMKLGQMLSSAPIEDEHLPPEVKDALAVLQREAPPMPWSMVVSQIEAAFDRPISDVYRYFDPEPLAAASIGQVHRAETFDGRKVAVKVQYPGVRETLDADLKNLSSLMQLARGVADRERVEAYAAEVREVIFAESDYVAEARNLERFRELFAVRDDVRVPRPIHDLTRQTVLTMEYIEGRKLDTWLLERPQAERTEITVRFVRLFAWMFHDLQVLHADPHPGNFLVDDEGRFVLLDFGCVREFDAAFTDGFLEILAAMWEGRADKLPSIFEDMGFGSGSGGVNVEPEVLEGWLRIVALPFMAEGEFDFGSWNPRPAVRRYFRTHLSLLKLTPPSEAIFFFRVCGGAWGILQRMGVADDFRTHAMETAVRRGVLPETALAAP